MPARPAVVPLEDRSVPATVGGLDPTFAAAGRLAVNVAAGANALNAVAVQPDGRIVFAGTTDAGNPTNSDFLVTRYLINGTPDPTFGTDGRVTINFGTGKDDAATGVVIQADGRIVVGGWTNKSGTYDFAAVRLFANGGLDPSFGTAGFAIVPIANTDKAYALAEGRSGALVLAGVASAGGDDDLGVVRLTADGQPDATFNAGVGRQFSLGGQEQARAAAVLSDSSILLAGYQTAAGKTDTIVVRVAPDGTFTDSGYGNATGDGNKYAKFDLGGEDKGLAIAARADGSAAVAGYATPAGTSRDFALAAVTSAGVLDTTVAAGTGGVTVDFGGTDDEATGVTLQPDGRAVLTGFTNAGGKSTFAAARLTPAAVLDPSFNGTGKVTVSLAGNDQAFAAARDAAGRLIVAGKSNGNLAAVRLVTNVGVASDLLAGGSLDGSGVLFRVPPGGTAYDPGPATPTQPLGPATPTRVPFFSGFDRNVRVAVADVTGDGIPDRIAVAGPGAPPLVTIWNGALPPDALPLVAPPSFAAFELTFTGGLYVAAADLDGDGRAEIIVTPDEGGGPVVAVYSGAKLAAGLTGDAAQLTRFLGIDDGNFRGGARPAVGDVNADGTPDVIVSAGFGGGPRVAIFDGKFVTGQAAAGAAGGRLRPDFFAFEDSLRNGSFVAAGDLDGDGAADLVFGGGPGGGPRVRAVSGKALLAATTLKTLDDAPASGFQLANFFVGDAKSRGGVPVAVKDVDGDQYADVVAASGQGQAAKVSVYRGVTLRANQAPPADQSLDVFANAVLANGVYVG